MLRNVILHAIRSEVGTVEATRIAECEVSKECGSMGVLTFNGWHEVME